MAQISLRVDDELKRGAEKTLNDYTLSRSSISMQYIRLPSG